MDGSFDLFLDLAFAFALISCGWRALHLNVSRYPRRHVATNKEWDLILAIGWAFVAMWIARLIWGPL